MCSGGRISETGADRFGVVPTDCVFHMYSLPGFYFFIFLPCVNATPTETTRGPTSTRGGPKQRAPSRQPGPPPNNAAHRDNVSRPTLTLALDDVRSLETFWPAHVNVAPFQTTWVLRFCKGRVYCVVLESTTTPLTCHIHITNQSFYMPSRLALPLITTCARKESAA